MSWPAATSASRLGTAKSGDPMKTMRIARALASLLKRGQGVRIMASQEIEALSQALARLPGLGPRSARRAVLHLMKKRETALEPLLTALEQASTTLSVCDTCGNVDTINPCGICADPRRDARLLCVVEE